MVYGISVRMTGNPADADELAHDSFVEAFLKLSQIRDPERFGGWLKSVTMNLCRMHSRRRRRRAEVELCDNLATPEQADEAYSTIYSGMSRISSSHRLVLVLHYFEGLSYTEIARFLEIPIGTVMSRLNRARKLLKEELNNMSDETDLQSQADLKFKEEVQAEATLILSMKPCRPGVGVRLKSLFEKSPERFVRLLAESKDETILRNIAVILPRLETGAIQSLLAVSTSSDKDLLAQGMAVLRKYIERCTPESVPGAVPDMASTDAYLLIDQLVSMEASYSAKARVLKLCAEWCRDSSTKILLTNALLCYPSESFDMLMTDFESGDAANRWVLHALVRFGDRFCTEVHGLLASDDRGDLLLGLQGFDAIARSMMHDFSEDSPLDHLQNERRIAEKHPPMLPSDFGEELLQAMTSRLIVMLESSDTEIRDQSISILGCLHAPESLEGLRLCLLHEDLSTRVAAIRTLAQMNDSSVAGHLVRTARDGQMEERLAALAAIGKLGVGESVPLLESLATASGRELHSAAISALGGIDSPDARAALQGLLVSESADIRKLAAKALYGGVRPRRSEPSEVDLRLAVKRGKRSKPISFVSLDATIRFGLTELRTYGERELTERIACICEDYCATRRYLIERRLMTRADGVYSFTPAGEAVWRVERFIAQRTGGRL